MFEDNDDRRIQHIQLQILKQSNPIIWGALATLLSELESDQASDLLKRLAEILPDFLETAGLSQSAVAEHLGGAFQILQRNVLGN